MNRFLQHNQLWQMILARFKETIREPGVIFWGMIFPMLMSLGLGIAFLNKTDIIRNVAIISEETGHEQLPDTSLRLEHFLAEKTKMVKPHHNEPLSYSFTFPDEKLGNTTFLFRKMTWDEAMILLKRGNLSVAMTERNGIIRYHFDPMNPDAQLTYLRLSKIFGIPELPVNDNTQQIEPLTVSGTRYIDFLIPGLIAMGVMMSSMWGISYDVIEKRAKKLLRRMVATPMRKTDFLIALMTVRLTMNFVEAALLFIFASIVFGITIQGSILALFVLFISGNIAFAGLATFISSHTSKTEIGNGFINAVVMPMMVLSGIFFSYHNFPDWCIAFIKPLPLTLLADGLRSIFIEGAGFSEAALPSFVLSAIGIVFFAAGLKVFKWH